MEIELITDNQMKALNIIRGFNKVKPIEFAKAFWKESKMHNQKEYRINRYALSYLFKLEKRGFVKHDNYIFSLTEKGLAHANETDF